MRPGCSGRCAVPLGAASRRQPCAARRGRPDLCSPLPRAAAMPRPAGPCWGERSSLRATMHAALRPGVMRPRSWPARAGLAPPNQGRSSTGESARQRPPSPGSDQRRLQAFGRERPLYRGSLEHPRQERLEVLHAWAGRPKPRVQRQSTKAYGSSDAEGLRRAARDRHAAPARASSWSSSVPILALPRSARSRATVGLVAPALGIEVEDQRRLQRVGEPGEPLVGQGPGRAAERRHQGRRRDGCRRGACRPRRSRTAPAAGRRCRPTNRRAPGSGRSDSSPGVGRLVRGDRPVDVPSARTGRRAPRARCAGMRLALPGK